MLTLPRIHVDGVIPAHELGARRPDPQYGPRRRGPPVRRFALFVRMPLLFVLAACGGAQPEAVSPAPSATASAAPSASAPEPPAKVAPDADGPDGVRRWAAWEGPKNGASITTKRAWVVAPNTAVAGSDKLSFASVELRVVDVEKAGGEEIVFRDRKQTYAVPAALAWPAEAPKGLAKGAVARCAFGGNSVVARVEAADAKGASCAFRFMEKTRRERVAATDVLKLTGKIEPGAPALVRFGSDATARYRGVVMAASGDDVWVKIDGQFGEGDARAGRAVHKIKADRVESIDLAKPLKAKDACLAVDIAGVVPCKVGKVIEGGLAYVVDFEGGSASGRKEWTFDEVAPAAK